MAGSVSGSNEDRRELARESVMEVSAQAGDESNTGWPAEDR